MVKFFVGISFSKVAYPLLNLQHIFETWVLSSKAGAYREKDDVNASKCNSLLFEMQHDLNYFYGPISGLGLLVSPSALYEFNACAKKLIESGIKWNTWYWN